MMPPKYFGAAGRRRPRRQTPDPDDARARRVALTSEGRRVLKATAPEHVERVRSWIIDPLDRRDVVELGRIATTLLAHLHDVAPAEAG